MLYSRYRSVILMLFLFLPSSSMLLSSTETQTLNSGKIVFGFSVEDFHEGWQRVNHLLGTPFGDLLLSSVQHTPSRGRFVEASLTAQTSLLLYLDPQEDFITSILFKSPLPQKQFDHMIFHNLVTLLVSLVSYNIDFKTFDAIFKPLKKNQPSVHTQLYEDIFYISYTNRQKEFILVISPRQHII
ncbi:hypothetical protein [Entomospira culicis]|uniref:Uncharacterized protein n=1 Tax=Entomospira culicis TaxID=2719989 RepID=A0A968KXA9_9SPIO|nr:hypothetical protein [Entomospira culicis]NIZ19973.1 hypothetical protein [Entomospira culicis]NIZ70162.1 hypothetical protein [Entomospira culicis]WDI37995.1 hypothetical protein PVA46_08075 [Entomospira culicis]WDI39618.1 hypothetical protein PVA47_08075 [Entomospira culicis]